MAITDLIPWKKNESSLPIRRRQEEDTLHDLRSQMNRLFDEFFEQPFGLGTFLGDSALMGDFAQRLFLGTSGGAGATHIRHSVNNRVYLTADLAAWEVSPTLSSWIDTTYLTLNQDHIQSFSVENANGTFKFIKEDDGLWTYAGLGEGEEFDADALQTTISRLASIWTLEPLGTEADPVWGFDKPGAIAILELQDDSQSTSQETIIIGGLLGGNYAAKASNSPYYVTVAPVYASSLLEMDHINLLVADPTPTPTTSP